MLRAPDADAARALDCALPTALGAVEMTRPSPEELELEAAPARAALLVLAEHFDPGWSVSLDGGEARPALQIDRAALGASVPAGRHRLRFRFFPRGLAAGLLLAAAVALGLGLAALRSTRAGAAPPRRRGRSAP